MKKAFLFLTTLLTLETFSTSQAQSEAAEILQDEFGIKHIYMPWRGEYIRGTHSGAVQKKSCPFCRIVKSSMSDEEALIVKRYQHHVVMLNLVPYIEGHLLIIPTAHITHNYELEKAAQQELAEVIAQCEKILFELYGCDGMNIGLNIGATAGASVVDHLHVHLVPRYANEQNFLQVIGRTSSLCVDPYESYKKLKPAFDA